MAHFAAPLVGNRESSGSAGRHRNGTFWTPSDGYWKSEVSLWAVYSWKCWFSDRNRCGWPPRTSRRLSFLGIARAAVWKDVVLRWELRWRFFRKIHVFELKINRLWLRASESCFRRSSLAVALVTSLSKLSILRCRPSRKLEENTRNRIWILAFKRLELKKLTGNLEK